MLDLEYIQNFRNGQTDAEIIGDAKQPGDEWFIDHHKTYGWYYAIAAAKQPKAILELGVRYGYSLIAMAKGACKTRPDIVGVDDEFDGIPSNQIARKNLDLVTDYARIVKWTTRDTITVYAEIKKRYAGKFDIIHVDGDHSESGIQNELAIAKALIDDRGWILIDDIDTPHVFAAASSFAVNHRKNCIVIPTFHGLLLVDMGS